MCVCIEREGGPSLYEALFFIIAMSWLGELYVLMFASTRNWGRGGHDFSKHGYSTFLVKNPSLRQPGRGADGLSFLEYLTTKQY